MTLTASRVREVVSYDSETGLFRWRKGGPGRAAGSVAGSLARDGYWRVKIDYLRFTAGRLAWLYVTGEWPPDHIDHIDGDRANNRWVNLRSATRSQNNANRRAAASKLIPVKGVYYKSNAWEASIQRDGRPYYLGRFKTIEEAQAAYASAAQALFGEFAKVASC